MTRSPHRFSARRFLSLALLASLLISVLTGCGEDTLDKSGVSGEGVVKGVVSYSGTKTILRIGFALMESNEYPPTQMPAKMAFIPKEALEGGLTFPYSYQITEVADGTYWLAAYGDVDASGGSMQSADDATVLSAIGPVTIVNGGVGVIDVTLHDPGANVDGDQDTTETAESDLSAEEEAAAESTAEEVVVNAPTPDAGKAALYGVVNYAGAVTGRLNIIGFKSAEPGMPKLYKQWDDVTFPFVYEITNAPIGEAHLFSFLDYNTDDGMMNVVGDPDSGAYVKYELAADTAYRVDFTLTDTQ